MKICRSDRLFHYLLGSEDPEYQPGTRGKS
jgi:hypothetical protein